MVPEPEYRMERAKSCRAKSRLCSPTVHAQENRSSRTLSHLFDWILRARLLGTWLIGVDALLATQQEFLVSGSSSSWSLLRRQT